MMVIDLTQSDPEDYPGQEQPKPEQKPTSFFSNLAHRVHLYPLSGKRKREPSPETDVIRSESASSATSSRPLSNGTGRHNHLTNNVLLAPKLAPATPSPSPSLPDRFSAPSVVVPSPSRHLKREIDSAAWHPDTTEITGMSQKLFPTNVFDKRARKGAYRAARTVNRADVPFRMERRSAILHKRLPSKETLRQALKRNLDKLHGPKVTFASQDERALEHFASNFEFVNSYKLQKGVTPADSAFDCGCECGPICDPEECLCLDEGDSDEEDDESTSPKNRKIVSYQRAPGSEDLIVLTPEFLKRKARIAECGRHCKCDKGCWNRVVQRGRTIRLEIFDTSDRGFGLRSPDPIRAGQFIDCYRGEVITREEADTREDLAIKQGHSYLFSLDFSPEATEDKMYVVDGQRYGSPTRFMNHSCNPNCRMFPVSHTHADHNLYDLAFFALRDISPMTELTFDYNPGAKQANTALDPNVVRCRCGEKNCRGQLWPNQRKGTK